MSHQKFRCINGFTNGARIVGGGSTVESDDSILETHRAFFVPVASVEAAAKPPVRVECATAEPNDLRTLTQPQRRGPGRPRKNPKIEPVEPPAAADPEPVVESSAADTTED